MANYPTDTLDLADGKSGEVFPPFAKWYLINGSMEKVFTTSEYCIFVGGVYPHIFKIIF